MLRDPLRKKCDGTGTIAPDPNLFHCPFVMLTEPGGTHFDQPVDLPLSHALYDLQRIP
jgi:hypothetical protein